MDNNINSNGIPGCHELAGLELVKDGDNIQLSEELSSIVIHIKFCSAFSGRSITVLPAETARSLIPFTNHISSSPEASTKVACGCMKVLIWLNAADAATSIRKSVLCREKSGRPSKGIRVSPYMTLIRHTMKYDLAFFCYPVN